MTSTRKSSARASIPTRNLTITEVKVKPGHVLGGNRIYIYAALGAALGVLLGVGVAWLPVVRGWPALKIDTVHAKTISVDDAPRVAKDLGTSPDRSRQATSPQN